MKKICILDYGSGNIQSLKVSINFLGTDCKVSSLKKDIESSSHIILPGVGSYKKVLTKLKEKIDIDFLEKQIITKGKYFIGICVGMQILSTTGSEHGLCKGLDWISGKVDKIKNKGLTLPHVGWNEVDFKQNNKLPYNKSSNAFYFTHSYAFKCLNKKNVLGTTCYGEVFDSAINKDNIYGVQFHPEKSQKNGLAFLKKFLNLI